MITDDFKFYTIDFETYYDREYSLTKLTIEQYIRDARFEPIMCGLITPDGQRGVVSGTVSEMRQKFEALRLHEHAVLAHHALFDAPILTWVFGIRPAIWLDSLSMARAFHPTKSLSLAALAKHYGLEDKGTFVANMMGRRRVDMSPGEFQQYARYCLQDVKLTRELFQLMAAGYYSLDPLDLRDPFPTSELALIDRTTRMFSEPVLRLNSGKLQAHLDDVIANKDKLLDAAGIDVADLMSNQKFALVLESLGVDPPRATSKVTGKVSFSFSKVNPAMKALLEHSDPRVQAVAAARMGVKSTLEETRTRRLLEMSQRSDVFPIPLRYYAAKTGRAGGTDSVNLQNLPSRGNTSIKSAIEAPPGHTLIDCDSSNIEARVLAWLAEQNDLVADFAANIDVYCKFGERVYGRTITKKDILERFTSKTLVLGCLAEGTRVLCERGIIPIEHVTVEDRVWDGQAWVSHGGLLKQGCKPVLSACGVWMTPDHQVLCGTEWHPAESLHRNGSLSRQALDTAAGNLPSLGTSWGLVGALRSWWSVVTAGARTTRSSYTTTKDLRPHAAIFARMKRLLARGVSSGGTSISCPTTPTGSGYLTAYLLSSPAAIPRLPVCMRRMAGAVFTCMNRGAKISGRFSHILSPLKGGMTRLWNLIASIMRRDIARAICGFARAERIATTGGRLEICSSNWTRSVVASQSLKRNCMTYDLHMAGPRNRFTVIGADGPLIVHNCGYGTGYKKLQLTLKVATPSIDIDEDEAKRLINIYRTSYPKIPIFWKTADKAIEAMYEDRHMEFGVGSILKVEGKRGIRLPNGLYLQYPGLHRTTDPETGKQRWMYKNRNGMVDIYGSKLVENICQAIARIIVMRQLLKIANRYTVALTVHDSNVAVVRTEEVSEAREFVMQCMRWVPKFAQGCPINCESKVGTSYGEMNE